MRFPAINDHRSNISPCVNGEDCLELCLAGIVCIIIINKKSLRLDVQVSFDCKALELYLQMSAINGLSCWIVEHRSSSDTTPMPMVSASVVLSQSSSDLTLRSNRFDLVAESNNIIVVCMSDGFIECVVNIDRSGDTTLETLSPVY